uniref:Tyrosine-protein phosphatase domain-containing protein n=1 Tax=Parascaris univalens TaxID=6257 RepID=A0A914ZXV8_PARUN
MLRRHTRRLQINAFHRHVSHQQRNKRALSAAVPRKSASDQNVVRVSKLDASSRLMDYPTGEGGRLRLPAPLRADGIANRDVVHNKADEKRWMRRMRLKKVKVSKRKDKERVERARDEPASIDLIEPVAFPRQSWMDKCVEEVSDLIFNDPPNVPTVTQKTAADGDLATFGRQFEDYKNTRFKYFLARRTLDKEPTLLENEISATDIGTLRDTTKLKKSKSPGTPGAYSLLAESFIHRKEFSVQRRHSFAPALPMTATSASLNSFVSAKSAFSFEKEDIERVMTMCRKDDALTEQLLYDVRYDSKWKSHYTKELVFTEDGDRKKKPRNTAGWVNPLRRLCMKFGFNSSFFTDNRNVKLSEARAFVLHQRLTAPQQASTWLSAVEDNVRNERIEHFFSDEIEGHNVHRRMILYNRNIENDRDRVRVHGRYYNNIYLGKRMFGPGRKQMFLRTVVGGMERRFEILDNQVNHIVFSHDASDCNANKCRNPRVKCRDSTRVVLYYPPGTDDDFIHANYVRGGPLFNTFIITQAPMENTVGDFWRMIWQERAPYIFMLISRKDPKRCANYWPRKNGSSINCCGLVISNEGIDDYRYPNFRVTLLSVEGPDASKLHVEHWQADMNNADNVAAPLQLLRLARNTTLPTVVHCHLGISRSAAVVAAEICITSLLKGPSYKHTVQKAVQLLRSQRAFAIETPMQYIYVHRVVQQFIRPLVGDPDGFHLDYKRWMEERAQRPFVDDITQSLASYRQLSPPIDPDLIVLARHRERPDYRRETHDYVGQLPIPLVEADVLPSGELQLPKKYPRGNRYP